MKLTVEDFLLRSTIIHKDKYEYPNLKFKNVHSYIEIKCKIHGIFIQKIYNHLNGQGCRECYNDSKKSNKDIFVEKSNIIYPNKYDYSKFIYINSKSKSIVICKNSHEVETTPNRHLSGKTFCKKCYQEEYNKRWIPKLEQLKCFEYLKIEGEVVDIKCLNCSGIFKRKCSSHLKLKNCVYCKPNKHNIDIFIKNSKKVHGDNYDYSDVEYKTSRDKVILKCKNGHEFTQKANNHINGTGCPSCNRFDKKENSIIEFLKKNYDGKIVKGDRTILYGQEIDIYLPELKIGFEFNGIYWHSELFKHRNYHFDKSMYSRERGISLTHIWEDDYENKKEIVESIILNKIGKSKKIYARKCEIEIINDNKLIRDFLEKNHIQGFTGSIIKIGLFYNKELVSIMTFGGLRKHMSQKQEIGTYELLRFCNKINTTVVGGASKLLNYFIKNYDASKIISYSDNSRGHGNLYEKLGFKIINHGSPGYYWVVNGIRRSRYNFRKDILVGKGFDKSKSETQIMKSIGYYRIFDSGSSKWELRV